jgi:hypothetical protein
MSMPQSRVKATRRKLMKGVMFTAKGKAELIDEPMPTVYGSWDWIQKNGAAVMVRRTSCEARQAGMKSRCDVVVARLSQAWRVTMRTSGMVLALLLVLSVPSAQAAMVTVRAGERIQTAIDNAATGDVILIDDGVYHEVLAIAKPVTLRAKNGGKVTLTNMQAAPIRFEPDGQTPGMYVADVAHPVRWVMKRHRNLYNYISPEDLRNFTAQPAHTRLKRPESGLFPEGFAWSKGKLYVRLEGNADPRNATIEINSANMNGRSTFLKDAGLTPTESYTRPSTQPVMLQYPGQPDRPLLHAPDMGVLVSIESDDVTLEGLRLHLAPDVLVDVKRGHRVTVRNCYFDGFQYAVNTGEDCVDLRIEYCEFSGGELYERFRSAQKAVAGKRWEALYFSTMEIIVISQRGPGFIFQHNFVYEAFDGVQPRGVGTEWIGRLPDRRSEIAFNVVMNCVDDNFELDSWDRLANTRVHHNLAINGSSLLSCAPIQRGPLLVDHNIFYNAPENGLHGGYLLKHNQQAAPQKINTGLTVVHNTFVTPHKQLWTDEWFPPKYGSNTIENNIMIVAKSSPWDRDGFTPSRHNLLWGEDTRADHIAGAVHAPPRFVNEAPYDFRLAANSPAIGAGVNRDDAYHHRSRGPTDLGAVEHGDDWTMPRPGPRWATPELMPARPRFPASFSPRWAGFGADSNPR